MKNRRLIILCVLLTILFVAGCPVKSPEPVTPADPPEAAVKPAANPPVATRSAPQETPEEKAVRERLEQLGGTCRKNPAGRIVGIVIENNELTVEDMRLIAGLPDLESIRIIGPSVTDAYVEAISGLTRLKSVDIEGSNITDRSLEILKTLPDIETLSLRQNGKLSNQAVALLAEFPNLKTLSLLFNNHLSTTSLYGLGKLSSLRVLDVRGCKVGDDTLIFIAELENLEEIHIRSELVTNDGLELLAECKNLKILELQDTKISRGCADHFKDMKNLRSLRIFRASIGPEDIAELGALTNLETLELRNMNCSNEALKALKSLTRLSRVEFSELTDLDEETVIDVLKAFPRLENLRMFAMPVGDPLAAWLATVPTLKSVGLPATAITDKGLESLTALQGLTSLDIHGNKERITLEGARVLARFKNLRRLIIPETLDDDALKAEILKSSPRCVITPLSYAQEG